MTPRSPSVIYPGSGEASELAVADVAGLGVEHGRSVGGSGLGAWLGGWFVLCRPAEHPTGRQGGGLRNQRVAGVGPGRRAGLSIKRGQ
jgi:hypothetical protein